MIRWIGVAVAGVLIMAGAFFAGTASAARPEPFLIEADCGADGMIVVAGVPGNGRWTPVHVVGGGTFIPVAFTNGHGTFTDNEGNTETFEDPDAAKAGPTKKDFLNCHYTVQIEDENGSGSFEGDVKGFVAGN